MKKTENARLSRLAPEAETAAPAAQAPDYGSGTPWVNSDLEGSVTPETETDLKNDFYRAVNKQALLKLTIPEGYAFAGTLMDVILQQAQDVKGMFLGHAPEGHDAQLAYKLFWLMMDWPRRNALGVAPLKKLTERIEAISSIEELTAYFLETPPEEVPADLWSCGGMTDFADASHYILAFADAGVLLGDSAEYKTLTPHGKVVKEAYTTLAEKMLRKLGYSEQETAQKIENCFALDTRLAEAIFTREEQQSPDYHKRIYNLYTRAQLEQMQGKLPLLAYLEGTLGYPAAEKYVVLAPAYFRKLNELCTEENLPLIRDELIVCAAVHLADRLDRECYEWDVACANAIKGSTGMKDDETAFSGSVADLLDWPVARLYTECYLKPEDKARIGAMIDAILTAYRGILSEAEFLSDATRAKAIAKLDAISKRVLYPDSWDKYSFEALDFASREEGGTYWDACGAIARFRHQKELEKTSKPVDRERWLATPQTVNCAYSLQRNCMYIFGAFARGELYNSGMSDEELYAKLGAVIGHEISHAFDANGAQFDQDGNMAKWWTEEDYAAFVKRDEKLAAYYNAMHPWAGQDFHGGTMTGEACADMAGVKVMLRIAKEKPGFDYDAFFRSYAALWLTKDSLQHARARINDVHPMPYLRVNATLQQFDEFLETYGIAEGDGMYLAPENRVAIW